MTDDDDKITSIGRHPLARCPRCGDAMGGMPALSRRDDETEVCGPCSGEESALQGGYAASHWNVTPPRRIRASWILAPYEEGLQPDDDEDGGAS